MRRVFPAAVLVVSSPAGADALQDQLVARMRTIDTSDVAFTQTTRVEQIGGKTREFVTRYDPAKPQAARWSVVSVDGHPPTDKERADTLKAARGGPLPSYAKLAQWFGAAATRTANGGAIVYRFAALPKGTVKIGNHDASADTSAEAVVSGSGAQAYVERVRFSLREGFRMMLVAKVEGYAFTSTYAPLADGRVFPVAVDGDISGSMMGKSGSIKTRIRYIAAK
ncbi:hypothetical protein GGQ80_002686 [Sphingomonas jinjuensis]|uniref:Uncharacterized protein n=1 Tax=Sphingomonas jinjuensis TaxID=535907 RepID=A0A840F9U1_9SPHN|nr:hypothetical protein [Sphingomonas jinjuensis]MBB4154770.1 hypothetical protein [Sphingomonas jinjuensis]